MQNSRRDPLITPGYSGEVHTPNGTVEKPGRGERGPGSAPVDRPPRQRRACPHTHTSTHTRIMRGAAKWKRCHFTRYLHQQPHTSCPASSPAACVLPLRALAHDRPAGSARPGLAQSGATDVRVGRARSGDQLEPFQPGQGSGTRRGEHRQRLEPVLRAWPARHPHRSPRASVQTISKIQDAALKYANVTC